MAIPGAGGGTACSSLTPYPGQEGKVAGMVHTFHSCSISCCHKHCCAALVCGLLGASVVPGLIWRRVSDTPLSLRRYLTPLQNTSVSQAALGERLTHKASGTDEAGCITKVKMHLSTQANPKQVHQETLFPVRVAAHWHRFPREVVESLPWRPPEAT